MEYIYRDTKKEIHGWYVSENRRECTSERLLINPYNGCSVGCFYCYSRALPGYFDDFHRNGNIYAFPNFASTVRKQLQKIFVASCGYLSPVTDPFQKIETELGISKSIIKTFLEFNLPIEFITKCEVPLEVVEMLKWDTKDKNSCKKHCFGQVSILTVEEKLRRILSPGGVSVKKLFNNLRVLSENKIFAVCRIDPILPCITDDKENLKEIVIRTKDSGVKHIIASVLDIPLRIYDYVLGNIKRYFGTSIYYKYKSLYKEKIGYLNANLDYRLKIFDYLRNLCDRYNLTFALCMEYKKKVVSEKTLYEGLNKVFMSSKNCEGIDIPVYGRKEGEKKFYPLTDCDGACLYCQSSVCGVKELPQGNSSPKGFKLKDYKKFGFSNNLNSGVYLI